MIRWRIKSLGSSILRAQPSLQVRGYTPLLCVQFVSMIGSSGTRMGVSMLAFDQGIWARCGLALLGYTTYSFISWRLSLSRLGDYFPRRSTMLATMAAQMLMSLLLGVLQFEGLLSLWEMYILSVPIYAIAAAYEAVEAAFVQSMVPAALLQNALVINTVLFGVTAALGSTLSGFLSAPGLKGWLFIGDALSFVLAICYMARNQQGREWPQGKPTPGEAKRLVATVIASLRPQQLLNSLMRRRKEITARGEAWASIKARHTARWALILYGVVAVFFMQGAVLQPLIGYRLLGGPKDFAWISTASALSITIAPATVAFLQRRPATVGLLWMGALWGGTMVTLYGAAFSLLSSLIFMVVSGLGFTIVFTNIQPMVVQERDGEKVPENLLVRLNAIRQTVWTFGITVANLLAGVVATTLGVRAASVGLPVTGMGILVALGVVYWYGRRHGRI